MKNGKVKKRAEKKIWILDHESPTSIYLSRS
jgi:hypothetical protein